MFDLLWFCLPDTVPSILRLSTDGEDDRREVVIAVVFAHRTDLPVGVKTSPWYIRVNRLPELPENPQLLLLAEHRLASRGAVEMEHQFGLVAPTPFHLKPSAL